MHHKDVTRTFLCGVKKYVHKKVRQNANFVKEVYAALL